MNGHSASIFTCMALAIVIAGSSCKNKQAAQQPPMGMADSKEPQQYSVLQITAQPVSVHTDYPATLQGEEVVEIRPKIEGYLEEQYVDEGTRVKRGQKLFRISNPQYEQELRSAEAGVNTAQADIKSAELTVNKTKPLVEKEIISKYELEAAEYTLQSKKAALVQAQATLANARVNLGYTIITSPSNGIIGTIPYKKGSLVSGTSTNPLTTLSADKGIYAYFALNEKQLLEFNRTFKGATIQDKLRNLPAVQLVLADGTLYNQTGKVETASGLLTTETGSSNFRATFPNPDGLLKSGGSASVRIPRSINDALLIPQSATYELQDKRLVYTVGNDNKVLSKAITTTPTDDGKFFIVTDGLVNGDKIVLNGLTSLKDSMAIKPAMANPQTIYSALVK
jgi:membrane fusion protein (multidrug efflux system)